MNISRHVMIRGHVQGVGYRAWTVDEARRHGLSGWVRNRRAGPVEALFCGEERIVREMIAACHSGPAGAQVTTVAEREASTDELEMGAQGYFSVLPTI